MKYKRVLLKLSGEALAEKGRGIDLGILSRFSEEIKSLNNEKVEVAVVIGGGNITVASLNKLLRWIDNF